MGARIGSIGGSGGRIRLVDLTVRDLGGGGFCGGAGGSLSGGTDSVRALAPARRLESEDNAGLCGHF